MWNWMETVDQMDSFPEKSERKHECASLQLYSWSQNKCLLYSFLCLIENIIFIIQSKNALL